MAVRVTQHDSEILIGERNPNVEVSQLNTEGIIGDLVPNIEITQIVSEMLIAAYVPPDNAFKTTQFVSEVLITGASKVRASQLILELLIHSYEPSAARVQGPSVQIMN